MMGVLPLQFLPGESRETLGLTGTRSSRSRGSRTARRREVDGARRREGVPGDGAARHAARARVPAPRRDPPVRAAAAARVLGPLPADEDRPAEELAPVAQVRALPALVPRPDLGRVGIAPRSRRASCSTARQCSVSYRSQSSSEDAITETTGRPDGLEDDDRALERRPRIAAILVVLGKRKPTPERLADGDVARRRRTAGASASTVSARLPKTKLAPRQSAASYDSGSSIACAASPSSNETRSATPGSRRPLERGGMELGCDLDPVHRAAELSREEQRRPATAGRDVEHARVRTEAEPLAEEERASPRRSGSGARARPRRRRSSAESRRDSPTLRITSPAGWRRRRRSRAAGGSIPVPARLRVLSGLDTGLLWGNLGVSLLVIVAGAALVPALSLPDALIAIVLGCLIGNLMLAVAGADRCRRSRARAWCSCGAARSARVVPSDRDQRAPGHRLVGLRAADHRDGRRGALRRALRVPRPVAVDDRLRRDSH